MTLEGIGLRTRSTGNALMLGRLGEVPWDTLEHAYRTAEDVPDLSRQPLAPRPKVRAEARHALYGNIFHQGKTPVLRARSR